MNIQIETGLLRRCHATAIVAVLALAAGAAQAQGIPGCGTWETTLRPRDLNGDSVADAFFDTALNITWLRNGNVNQDMNWSNANAWASNLVVGGIGGWRLPTMVDTGMPGCDPSNAGGTDCGFNVQTDSSELAHLYYVTLGNLAECAPGDEACTVKQAGFGRVNTGDFQNLVGCCHWTGVVHVNSANQVQVWMFNNNVGNQGLILAQGNAYAIAVHAGDVAAVPEPQTHALLLLGLDTLMLVCRRQRHGCLRWRSGRAADTGGACFVSSAR